MKFIYFTLPDGRYLSMNNLRTTGEFVSNPYSMPSLFPSDTTVEYAKSKVRNCPDLEEILVKTLTV
jgi:hypothetical protein